MGNKYSAKYIKEINIAPFSFGGEQIYTGKINPKKRHSKNNTIIGWNIYKHGKLIRTILRKT